ncbi:MAG: hypothetical protein PVJ67_04235 [Candidatus Pacearchaeota archaeon]|jgi:uncharacterized phiE125 gp8 family phage protein
MPVADTTIVTLDEMRSFLNIPAAQTGKDDLLIGLLDAYNGKMENYLGVTMISSTYSEIYDGNGKDYMFLKHYPINSVTSLSIDDEEVDSDDFYVYGEEGYIKLDSDTFTTTDYQNVDIVYVAGWGAAKANVPNVLKNALKTWVMRVFKAEVIDFSTRFDESSLANIKSQMMPWDIKQDLDDYRCRHWGR